MSDSGSEGGARRRGLAKGLSALLGDDHALAQADDGGLRQVPVEFLRPNPNQPRRLFDEDELHALADSIREKGVLQPLVVREDRDTPNSFEIVTGERRWRAAQLAQLDTLPVVIRELSDGEALEIALIENIQREDLTALEEANGYERLMDEFGHSQDELAQAIGKSRSHVANTLRLLQLPDSIKQMLDEGALTAGHARALLTSEDSEVLARQVVTKGLNVRQTEKLARRGASPKSRVRQAPEVNAATRDLETTLTNRLGLSVRIFHSHPGGKVEIRYKEVEQLDDIVRRLGGDGV